MVYLVFGKILNLLRHIFKLFTFLQMAKYWKQNLAIWSHWERNGIDSSVLLSQLRFPRQSLNSKNKEIVSI